MGSSIEEGNIMQRIRDAHTLAGNLAEELVRMEGEDKDGFWQGSDFFELTSLFLASLKALGFEIEPGSPGSQLAEAIRQEDAFGMSRFRFEIMSNLNRLAGTKRSGYMFFLFWPQLHSALNTEGE